jgi:hypothetical protein
MRVSTEGAPTRRVKPAGASTRLRRAMQRRGDAPGARVYREVEGRLTGRSSPWSRAARRRIDLVRLFAYNAIVGRGKGEIHMTDRVPTVAAVALFAVGIASSANVASAVPIADALAIKNTAPANIETVQWRGRGRGRGTGASFVGGEIIAGALAAPYYSDYDHYPYPYPGPHYGTYSWRWHYGPHYYYKWYHNPWYYRD